MRDACARLPPPTVAAITFDERGGGVSSVARLLRRVCEDSWGPAVRTRTLAAEGADGFQSNLLDRLRFGAAVAAPQWSAQAGWLLFTHLGLASVQRCVPRVRRWPYAVFAHDIEAWSPLSAGRRAILRDAFLRLANSRFTAARAMAANPDVGEFVACPLAIEDEGVTAGAAAPTWLERLPGPLVLTVGRLASAERYKGHDALVAAWPAVLRAVPDATLVFAGEGDDRPRLERLTAAAGLASRVLLPGFVDAGVRAALYERAAVFAMPSRREGFGLVYLEAMAHRLPVVASVHDAAPEIIEDGVSGFLVDQADLDGLAAHLVALLTRPDLRRAMGQAGRARFERDFTYAAFAERVRCAVAVAWPAAREQRAR